jgi:DNA repair protein RadC
MTELIEKMNIKTWAEEDRPREKLLLKGKHSLSDAELIAILIGSGNTKETAVELSKRILNKVSNNLYELGRLTVADLRQFRGIGEAKAVSILAALELGKRNREAHIGKKEKITSSKEAARIFLDMLDDISHEEFWVLLLNRANKVISKVSISRGGLSGTVVDTRMIFKTAIENLASSIILCHNHPSGSIEPSEADIKITKKIKEAGALLEIAVLDHIIVAGKSFYSFADEGIL